MVPVHVPQPASHPDPKTPPPISSSSDFHLNPNSTSSAPSSLPPDPSITAGASASSPHPPPIFPAALPSYSSIVHPHPSYPDQHLVTFPPLVSASPAPPLFAPSAAAGSRPPPATTFTSLSSSPLLPHPPPHPSGAFPSHPPGPAATPPGHIPTPLRSFAQAARGGIGSGFVRSHAADVSSFARLPRTGVSIVCGSKEGIPSVSFVGSDLPKVEDLFSNALVMKFHGGRPSLEASHREILSWGLEHPFTIGPLSSRAFLLRFQSATDLTRVLARPSTLLITFPYKIFRWHSLYHIKEDSCFAPVWISLPRLPLQCFIPEFLESVANQIGRFLCFDIATSTLARPSSARMCVELDLRKPLTPFIWVGLFEGFKQHIIYERMPKFCSVCQAQGHVASECPKGQRETPPPQAISHSKPNQERTQHARENASTRPNHQVPLHKPSNTSSTTPAPAKTASQPPPPPIVPPDGSSISSVAEQSMHEYTHHTLVNLPTSISKHPKSSALVQASSFQQLSSPVAAPPPPPQPPSNSPTAADHHPTSSSHIDDHLQLQPSASSRQRLPVTSAEDSPSVCHNAELPKSANIVYLVEDQQIVSIKEHPKSAAKPIKLKQLDVDQSPLLNQQQQDALERFKKKVRAQTQSQGQQLIGSTSANPFEALIEDQSDEEGDAFTSASFNSDTDDGSVEPIDMGYQSADGRSSHNHTKSSASVMKTNKRHPNIPLNVRLRARKNAYSSSHKYLRM